MTVTDTRTRPGSRERSRRRGRRPVPTSPFFTSALDGAPRWAVGALTAVQGALLSLLVIVLPAIAAYVATSADPSNAGVGWTRAVRVGSAVWLAGHGVPLHIAGVTVGLVPLGVTGLAVFACHASARRSGVPSRSAFVAGVAAYAATAGLVGLGVGVSGGDAVRGAVGAVLVAGLGLAGGLLRRHDAPAWRDVTRRAWVRVAAPVRCGAAAGLLAATLLLAAAACLVLLWIAAGRATIGDVVTGLHMDVVGGAVLAWAELAFLPNLVGWALAWLAGPGFHVGAGTHFAPGQVVTGPMPAIPMLGALPTGDFAGAAARLAPIVLVVAGLAAGWYVHRRLTTRRWQDVLSAAGTAGLTTGVLVLVLVALSSGSAGPGRLAQVGAAAWLVGLSAGAGVLVGALAIAVPLDERIQASVRRTFMGRHDDAQAREGSSSGAASARSTRASQAEVRAAASDRSGVHATAPVAGAASSAAAGPASGAGARQSESARRPADPGSRTNPASEGPRSLHASAAQGAASASTTKPGSANQPADAVPTSQAVPRPASSSTVTPAPTTSAVPRPSVAPKPSAAPKPEGRSRLSAAPGQTEAPGQTTAPGQTAARQLTATSGARTAKGKRGKSHEPGAGRSAALKPDAARQTPEPRATPEGKPVESAGAGPSSAGAATESPARGAAEAAGRRSPFEVRRD